MATITRFLSDGLHEGQKVALKIHEFRWRAVGHGEITALSHYEVKIEGHVALAVYRGDLHIRFALSDQDDAADTGPCSLYVNSVTDAKASYSTGQDGLSISSVMSGKDVQIRLSRAKRDNLTECKLSAPLNLTAYIDPSAS